MVGKKYKFDGIDRDMAKLNEVWSAASEEMYKATQGAEGGAQAGANPGAGPEANAADDEVQDVDFEEVKEDK